MADEEKNFEDRVPGKSAKGSEQVSDTSDDSSDIQPGVDLSGGDGTREADADVGKPFGLDLSGDSLPSEEADSLTLGAEQWQHQKDQQRYAFRIAAVISCALYLAAAVFAFVPVMLAFVGQSVDWHTWLIPVSFLLPPTVIVVALLRSVYPKTSGNVNFVDDAPATSTLREVCQTIRDVCKS